MNGFCHVCCSVVAAAFGIVYDPFLAALLLDEESAHWPPGAFTINCIPMSRWHGRDAEAFGLLFLGDIPNVNCVFWGRLLGDLTHSQASL